MKILKEYKRIKSIIVTLIFSLLLSVNITYSQNNNLVFNKYVTVNGAGNHDGSSLSNAWTIREAAANVSPGDIVFVQKGQYDITGTTPYQNITLSQSGTSVNPIVFVGEYSTGYDPEIADGSELAWFYCNSATNGQINIDGNYIEWRNIATYQVTGRQTYNISGDNVIIDSCVIITAPSVSSEHTFVIKPSSQNGILSNSYLLRSGRCHIYVEADNTEAANNWTMDANVFKGASNHNSIEYMPLTAANPSQFIYNCVIKNNTFIDNPYSHNILLRHNMNAKIYNNVFINSGYIKFEPHNYGVQTTDTVLVAYNTFVENSNDYVLDNQAMRGVTWKNNLIYYPSGISSLYLFRIGDVFTGHDFDYNFYYDGDGSFTPTVAYTSTLNYATGWKSAGFDNHSTEAIAPTFTNVGANDFSPLDINSPQVGKGTPITLARGYVTDILIDKNGNLRDPINPTIGAFEFSDGIFVDLTPPQVVSAVLTNATTLTINFSEELNGSTAQNINNYTISNGINVTAVSASGSQVTLTTSAHPTGSYVVTVNNVTDIAGNIISSNNNTANYDYSVVIDVTAPQVVSAAIIDSIKLNIYFSENIDPNQAQNINNYTINGISITNATLNSNVVTLSTSIHSAGTYSVLVSNISDLAGNVINPQFNSAIYEYQPNPNSGLLMFPVSNVLESVVPEPQHFGEKTIDGKGFYDNDPDSRWSGDTMPEWLVYDLGDIQILNITRLSFYKWNEGRTYNYTIQISTDSINWNTLRTNVVSVAQEWTEEEVGPVDARYIKIIFVSSNQNSWAGLWESEFWGYLKVPTNYEDEKILPASFILEQNYPNPFNPSTMIRIKLPQNTQIKLVVYNLLGEIISEVANGFYNAGTHDFNFDAAGLSSGIYIYRIESPNYIETKKMLLIR